jgi:hypothetical protein
MCSFCCCSSSSPVAAVFLRVFVAYNVGMNFFVNLFLLLLYVFCSSLQKILRFSLIGFSSFCV